MCKFSSCRAALNHLSIIICGFYVQQVRPSWYMIWWGMRHLYYVMLPGCRVALWCSVWLVVQRLWVWFWLTAASWWRSLINLSITIWSIVTLFGGIIQSPVMAVLLALCIHCYLFPVLTWPSSVRSSPQTLGRMGRATPQRAADARLMKTNC